MELSIAVGALTFYPLDTALLIARDAGATMVEVLLSRRMLSHGGDSIASQARRAGVSICTSHAVLSFRRQTIHEKIASDVASIRAAAAIESCRSIVLHTPLTDNGQAAPVQRWLDAIVEAREQLRPDLDLALENRAENWDGTPAQWLDDIGRLASVAGEWGASVCLDLAHAASFGVGLTSAIEAVGSQLVNVHLSDARQRRYRGGLLNGLLRDHLLPGDGALAIDTALADLAARDYRGPLTLELSPASLRAWLPGAPRRRLSAAIEDLQRRIGQTNDTSSETRPHRRYSR